tara:strand:+ start:381 stop:2117 length:1737 start_codon:yes stop_codon:yes gene_type:complete
MALVDIAGITSIMPFFAVLADKDLIHKNNFLKYIFDLFNFADEQQFLLLLGLAVFITILFSITFKAITSYFLFRYSRMRTSSISNRLLEKYLNQPYSWYLNKSSSGLFNNIINEVGNVVSGGLRPLLNLFSQGILVIAIIITLFIVDPFLAITLSLSFSFMYMIITFTTKNLLKRIGKERIKNSQSMISYLNESLTAFKEIKLAGLENFYSKKFYNAYHKQSIYFSISETVALMPKFLLEAISIGGMLSLVLLVLSRNDGSLSKMLPVLSIYAFATYRLMPALQQIYQAKQSIRFAEPSINLIYKEFRQLSDKGSREQLLQLNLDRDNEQALKLNHGIKFESVYYSYPGSRKNSIEDLSLYIKAKSKVGFVGSTGSGKTTSIDLILGLLRPNKGLIKIDGVNLSELNIRSWQNSIGYVPQYKYLSNSSIAENIAFGIDKTDINMNLVERAARIANLHNYVIEDLPSGYKTIIGERGIRLSGGQTQRIIIARALYYCPDILILDEATSALDNITEREVMEAINNLGGKITIILIAHRLSTVKQCDKIFLLEKGSIQASGSFEELKATNQTFQKMTENEA